MPIYRFVDIVIFFINKSNNGRLSQQQLGFFFIFSYYSLQWEKQINSIYTDPIF